MNEMEKFLSKGFYGLLIAATALCACSSDDETGSQELAAKTYLTLTAYCNAGGATTLPVWKSGDRGVLLLPGPGKSEAAYASPILPGSQSGFFLFNLEASRQAATVVSYYPADAAVVCEDGVVKTTLPEAQDGTVSPLLVGSTTARVNAYEGCSLELRQLWCTMYVKVNKGNYLIREAVVQGNNGEKIAGEIAFDVAGGTITATEERVTVTPPAPLDCREGERLIPVLLAPVTLSGGYTVTLTDTDGNTFSIGTEEPLTLASGERVDTGEASSDFTTRLLFCGDNMAYMIDAGLADADYKDAVVWSWDATSAASTLGLAASRCRVGEGKPVDNNRKLLLTGATGWCVLLDIATREILFHTTSCPNVHSAELLPGGRVALACSTGDGANNNKVQLYDIARPNEVIARYDLTSAHGVVWNAASERLYAIGGQSLQIYRLKEWQTDTPSLELEKTVTAPKSGLHDLTYVNANTLCLAGRGAYLYDIGQNKFTELTHFADYTALKSLNYNEDTGEAWYTDATVPEGNETWSTQTLRYTSNVMAPPVERTIRVPDVDVYKVRVLSW